MAKISVYINERASGTNFSYWKKALHKYLFRHNTRYLNPTNIHELKQSLAKDLISKTEYIFSIGGDGTANQITQFIAFSNIKLMVIPCGTANDFATELGLDREVKKIMNIFKQKTFKQVDLVKINEHYMFSNGGIGLASTTAQKINLYRKNLPQFKKVMQLLGSGIYPFVLGKELLFSPLTQMNLDIRSPDLPRRKNTFQSPVILINNQPKIGGRFCIAPETIHNDGYFNVTIFLHQNKRELILDIFKMLSDKPLQNSSNIISFETNQVSIQDLDNIAHTFFGDGETLEESSNFSISLAEKAIQVSSYKKSLIKNQSHCLDAISLQ